MQTWNSILKFIKRNLGAKLNILELSDDEIIEGLKEDALTLFSQYIPFKKYCTLTNENLIGSIGTGDTRWKYELPVPPEEYVIDIFEVYCDSTSLNDPFYGTKFAYTRTPNPLLYGYGSVGVFGGGIIDTVYNNTFVDIIRSLTQKNTFEFEPPRTIRFDEQIIFAVVVYNTVHEDPSTIPPDFYHIIFKNLCLGYVYKWIAALRSKYENITTPMGEIRLNWDLYEQKGDKFVEEAKQKLEEVLPDHFISIE